MMKADIPGQESPHEPDLTSYQRGCMQELIQRLKDITLRIQELDYKEERVQGDTSGSRDQLRAINISRIVYVNEQKDIEKQLSDIVNSCPPEPDTKPQPSPARGLEISHKEIEIEKVETDKTSFSEEENREILLDNTVEVIPVTNPRATGNEPPIQPRRSEPRTETRKPRFKFNVLSFNICPVCDARVPANYRICGRCATKLQNFCPHCGSAIPGGVVFCGKCGKKVT